ncbi:MAG TPA: transporter [Chitinispirillaceae bacterium]|nr:transporter [Chitinispirillaceae bacterium]
MTMKMQHLKSSNKNQFRLSNLCLVLLMFFLSTLPAFAEIESKSMKPPAVASSIIKTCASVNSEVSKEDQQPNPEQCDYPTARVPVDSAIQTEEGIVNSWDVENRHVNISLETMYRTYKRGGSANYIATPILVRIDTGKNTELRLSSDALIYQRPYSGVDDITVGMKWQFWEKNPSMGLLASVELPTGSPAFVTGGAQPKLAFLYDQELNKYWTFSANAGIASNTDAPGKPRYTQITYAGGFTRQFTDKHSLSLLFSAKSPDRAPNGNHLTKLIGAYTYSPNCKQSATITVQKGLSGRYINWQYSLGFGQQF